MSITSGFFDSKNGDRKYNAQQMGQVFDGIIRDGIFEDFPADGNHLKVDGSSDTSKINKVYVGPGKAWFHNTWLLNDGSYEISLAAPHATYDRKDAIVLEVRKNVSGESPRQCRIIAMTGTPGSGSAPTVSDDPSLPVYRYKIATVTVPHGNGYHFTENDSNIVNHVGTGNVPFVIGAVQSVTNATVLAQWETAVNNKIAHDLAEYLNDDGSALYQFLTDRFANINSFLSNPSAHFKKIFYYVDILPQDSSGRDYYGWISPTVGYINTIVKINSINGLYPRDLRVSDEGDVIISSGGNVAVITSVQRAEGTGVIESITATTIGHVDDQTRNYLDIVSDTIQQLEASTSRAVGQLQTALDDTNTTLGRRIDNLADALVDQHALFYLLDADAGSGRYTGALSPTVGQTVTIRINITNGAIDGLYPRGLKIKNSDVVINNHGIAAVVSDVNRSTLNDSLVSFKATTINSDLAAADAQIDVLKGYGNVFHYVEKDLQTAEAEELNYYGVIDTDFGEGSILSRIPTGGISGIYPRNQKLKVDDILIGSSGAVAIVTAIIRDDTTNLLTSVSYSVLDTLPSAEGYQNLLQRVGAVELEVNRIRRIVPFTFVSNAINNTWELHDRYDDPVALQDVQTAWELDEIVFRMKEQGLNGPIIRTLPNFELMFDSQEDITLLHVWSADIGVASSNDIVNDWSWNNYHIRMDASGTITVVTDIQ